MEGMKGRRVGRLKGYKGVSRMGKVDGGDEGKAGG